MTVIEDPAAPIAIPTRDEAKIARRERLRLLRRSPTFVLGSFLVGIWVVCAIFGTLIAPHDASADDVLNKLAAPSADHLFGTDRLGRD
ncbi:MAG: ABC transporter permease, partial [Gaiellaceae bacterium]